MREWFEDEDEATLATLKGQYRKMAVDQYYLLAKLDWFNKLRRKIVRQKQPTLYG